MYRDGPCKRASPLVLLKNTKGLLKNASDLEVINTVMSEFKTQKLANPLAALRCPLC